MMVFKAFCSTLSSGNNFIYDGSSAEGFANVSRSSTLTGDYTTGTLTGDNETYLAVITSASDYYPFGAQMPTRNINPGDYRFGFNGMERDDQLKGIGNSYDFGARIYDSRFGRWMSLDPLQAKYPSLSAYNFVGGSPLAFIDPDGEKIEWSENMSRSDKRYIKSQIRVARKSDVVYTITTETEWPGAAASFDPNLTHDYPETNEEWDYETNKSVVTSVVVKGESDGNFGGQLNIDMEAYGEHFSEMGEAGSEFFLNALTEEITHMAQYDLNVDLTGSNYSGDHPPNGNLELEAKTMVGMIQNELGISNIGGSAHEYGFSLSKGEASLSDYSPNMERWVNEERSKGSIYSGVTTDDSKPTLLNKYINQKEE